ncbi:hypothetical protein ON010_g677 [Phytophthora cinnamomi]|nr:hypothetical protein ON010_g677 [Phytophthora cinnamomi]
MADSGPRAWTADHPLYNTWTNLSHSWKQVKIQPLFDNLWNAWEQCFAGELLQTLPVASIAPTGSNGVNSRRNSAGLHGSLSPADQVIRSYGASQYTAGGTAGTGQTEATRTAPSS